MDLELDGVDAAAYYKRGLAYKKLRDHKRAIDDFTKAIELGNVDALVYRDRGLSYLWSGDPDQSIRDLVKAIELNSTDSIAYAGLGQALHDQGKYDQAITKFTKSIELGFNDYSARALSRHRLRDYHGAILDYGRALEIGSGEEAYVYWARGNVYVDLGDHRKAIGDYMKALEFDDRDSMVYNNRGVAYERLGDRVRAIADYTKAIELDPRNALFHCNRAAAYHDMGNRVSAVRDSTTAIELDPGFAKAYKTRANTCAELGELSRAVRDYMSAMGRKLEGMNAANDEQHKMNTRPTTIACPHCSHELSNATRHADPPSSSLGYGLDLRLIPADSNLSSEIAICPECLYVCRLHDVGEPSDPEIPRNVKDLLRSAQYKEIFADSSGNDFLARGWIALGARLEASGAFTLSEIGAINLRGSWAARELGCLDVEAELLSSAAKCFENALTLRQPQDTPDRLIYLLGEISRRRGEHQRGIEIVRFLTKRLPYRYAALMLTVLMEDEDSVPYWSLYAPEQMEQASSRFKGLFPSLRSIPPKKTTYSAEEVQTLI